MNAGEERSPWFGPFKEGERVRVIAGPFEEIEGAVNEINPHRRADRVTVTIFGRPPPVEREHRQLELT